MKKVWLESYPQGVPAEISCDEYASLADVLQASVQKFRRLPAFANFGTTLTYEQLDDYSTRFAAYLQQALGLQKGERLAIMLPNILQYPVALFGAFKAGLTVVNVNPLYTERELEYQLKDSGATAILVFENRAHLLDGILDKTSLQHVIVTGIGDLLEFPRSWLMNFVVKYVKRMVPAHKCSHAIDFRRIMKQRKDYRLVESDLGHDDIAFLQYTGGTTGLSKGAMLTHGNMVANVQQASTWLSPLIEERKEIIITALPLYHIFALTANCLTFTKFGGLNYLITNPRDLKSFVGELNNLKFTVITGVNTLFNSLLHTPGFAALDFSSLKLALGGGMAVQRTVAEEWLKITGAPLVEAYGLTETCPAACMNSMVDPHYNGSVGLPISSTECSIQDDQGNELPFGESGELCIRGPQVMKGYWNRPEETAKVLAEDGWFRSGDIATMDEQGYVRIVDRKKDMILVSGFNVYPNEVEEVVVAHPGVVEAAAVGVPNEDSGEIVKVFVVRKDTGLTAELLRVHCKQYLTAYKVPKEVEFVEALPKSNVGKILRRELRQQLADKVA